MKRKHRRLKAASWHDESEKKNSPIPVPELEIRQETKPTGTRVGGGAVLPKYDEDGKLLSYGHGTE